MRRTALWAAVLATGLASAGHAADVAITSVYTAMDSCVSSCSQCEGGEPRRCKGIKGYGVYESYSAWQTFRTVIGHEGFEVELAPAITCSYTWYGEKFEWRCADGEPFAVIHRVKCYDGEPDKRGRVDLPANFKGEFLLVRGLDGYERLSVDVDARKDKKANDTARKAADDFYKAQLSAPAGK